jgi:hypothetical protein
MRPFVDLHVDAQLVSTDDSARRVHEVHMARSTFGIKRPLNNERTFVVTFD